MKRSLLKTQDLGERIDFSFSAERVVTVGNTITTFSRSAPASGVYSERRAMIGWTTVGADVGHVTAIAATRIERLARLRAGPSLFVDVIEECLEQRRDGENADVSSAMPA